MLKILTLLFLSIAAFSQDIPGHSIGVGDSLIDDGIYEGDIAVVEITEDVRNGQLVAVRTDGGLLIKYFYRDVKRVRLEGRNASYTPLYFSRNQVVIEGIVRQIIRKIQ